MLIGPGTEYVESYGNATFLRDRNGDVFVLPPPLPWPGDDPWPTRDFIWASAREMFPHLFRPVPDTLDR